MNHLCSSNNFPLHEKKAIGTESYLCVWWRRSEKREREREEGKTFFVLLSAQKGNKFFFPFAIEKMVCLSFLSFFFFPLTTTSLLSLDLDAHQGSDQLVGGVMVSVATGVFFYYTFWVLILVRQNEQGKLKDSLKISLLKRRKPFPSFRSLFFDHHLTLHFVMCSLLWMQSSESKTFSRLASTPF